MENSLIVKSKIKQVILTVVISVIFSIIMSAKVVITESVNLVFNSFQVFWVLILSCYILPKIYVVNNKRRNIIVLLLSAVLAFCQSCGKLLDNDMSVIDNLIPVAVIFLQTLGLAYVVITIIYSFIDKLLIKVQKEEKVRKVSIIKDFVIPLGVFIVAYIPFFVSNFPGILSYDSIDQVAQAIGLYPLNNHHPVTHTLLIKLFIKVGSFIKHENLGVAMFSCFQILALSATFAYTIYYMRKKSFNKYFILLAFLFYALYPVHSFYSITMWKDIPFAICITLLTISLVELISNKTEFFSSKRKMIILSIVVLFTMLFRNNGLYVILILFFVLAIVYRKNIVKMSGIFIVPLVIYFVYTGPIFKAFGIKSGSIVEALSIPLQQMARISKECSNELTLQEKEEIYSYIPVENLGELYNPRLSDPVKSRADAKYISDNKIEFVKSYFKFAVKYPKQTIEALLYNSYGYYYPEASNWVVMRWISSNNEDVHIYDASRVNLIYVKAMNWLINQNIPIIDLAFSIGFNMWVVFGLVAYLIDKKMYNNILVFIPVLGVWLTVLASPVYCEYRYIYSLFTSMPVLISTIFIRRNNNG